MPELSRRVQTFTDSVIRRMTRISDDFKITTVHGLGYKAVPGA